MMWIVEIYRTKNSVIQYIATVSKIVKKKNKNISLFSNCTVLTLLEKILASNLIVN